MTLRSFGMLVALCLFLLWYRVEVDTPAPVFLAEPVTVPSPDVLRDSAIVYWSRMWGVDEGLMLYLSNEVENYSGDPTALGPRFCLTRAGQTAGEITVGPNLVRGDMPERSVNQETFPAHVVESSESVEIRSLPTSTGVSGTAGLPSQYQRDEGKEAPMTGDATGTCLQYTQAVGVMQIVPEVHMGTDNARMCNVRSDIDLFRAWPNACLGVLIYRTYLHECHGDVLCALGKYGGVATLAGRYYLTLYEEVL